MNEAEPKVPSRWIAHLDMDAFYASVELLRYPELRGKPVVVGGRRAHAPKTLPDGSRRFALLHDYAGRGVITTATYEARAFGVHSGMGLMKAAALAPDAALLPADFDQYRKYSKLFKAAVRAIAPQIENRGIDEIYIDLTDLAPADDMGDAEPHSGIRDIAMRIKSSVHKATGLTCSIGVSPNKLLSKLCSELEKPNGLTIITMADVPGRIWPLPASKINGIGPKASEKLASLGIKTIGELAAGDEVWLKQNFGANYGAWLHRVAHGRDERPVVTHSEPKSISRETTFERDLHARHDREELGKLFTRLCEQLASDLQRKGYAAKTIGVKLRFDDFRIVTRVLTADTWIQDAAGIRHWAGRALKKAPLEQKLRLLGVRAENLCVADALPREDVDQEQHDQLTLGLFKVP
ncbi:MAG: DNA polymerase IV [Betaproteobacteria bacterium]|nr:MAG: DNA polymerase IV [Betaproteobacteria bacterium]